MGLVLSSPLDHPLPSTRVAVLNMLPSFVRDGFEPVVLHAPSKNDARPEMALDVEQLVRDDVRVVLFQKVTGPSVLSLVASLRERGIRTIFVVCDLVDVEMARATDATIVVTTFLRSLYPADVRDKVHVIHDGIERPDVRAHDVRPIRGSRADPLRAVLVTSQTMRRLPVLEALPPWLEVTIVGRYAPGLSRLAKLRDAQWVLRQQRDARSFVAAARFLASSRIRIVPWSPEGVYDEIRAADIGILPIDRDGAAWSPAADDGPRSAHALPPSWMVRSENRLTLMMAAGLPVVATPIPSYVPVIERGTNGFLAEDRMEWLRSLAVLRDPATRASIGACARASVVTRFSQEQQASLWTGLFARLDGLRPQSTIPAVGSRIASGRGIDRVPISNREGRARQSWARDRQAAS